MIIYYTDRFAGGRAESRRLFKEALAAYTGDADQAKMLTGTIKKGEHGKPYIEGFSCFSISHTGSIWAVLIASCECGLDIQLSRNCDIRAISRRLFAPADDAGINEPDEFFRAWTRREALVKAFGGSVYEPDLPPVLGGDADLNGIHYTLSDIEFPAVELPDGRKLHAAVCTETGSPDQEIEFHAL